MTSKKGHPADKALVQHSVEVDTERPWAEAEMLERAVTGDLYAANNVLQYLNSSNPDLRHIMQEALHASRNPMVWRYLLGCLALGVWEDALRPVDAPGLTPHVEGQLGAAERHLGEVCWRTVSKAFTLDKSEVEKEVKQEILQRALVSRRDSAELHTAELGAWEGKIQAGPRSDPAPIPPASLGEAVEEDSQLYRSWRVQRAAAYLLGLRGNIRAIPTLEEIIEADEGGPYGDMAWKLLAIQSLAALHDERCGPPLVKALAMGRGALHQEARGALNKLGHLAQTAWLEALHHPDNHIRWHAARGLGQIGDPRAVEILAEGLYDENHAVRWATARVLARLDSAEQGVVDRRPSKPRSHAVLAILKTLTEHTLNEPFRQAAYHALHAMPSRRTQTYLKPLLAALRSPAASVEAPAVAQRLLAEWQEPGDLAPVS